ncbi:acyl-coenzyme A synthetase [Neoasaia chiangmaiensis NBRC 101099]|uniref:Uncharacterized protein n=1 Tax=Neoasaia chiangmaiensis TaxID=320497 RepID=A0A1U9KLT0_9PROT|nr:hypothetical protein A0U93_00940 [Neoasaia chiangmaiensis]GBR35562.1 acyl-coenzyme A synthetase [Neoasaia chiangmaiensis NBRC 101099]GEN16393.1 AMP-ligase [Neoasaia chiangmaiensis]
MQGLPQSSIESWPDLSLVHAPERMLLLRGDRHITGTQFLAAAHRLAALLPDRPVMPLCGDTGRFMFLFAATLLRGKHALLTSERAADRLFDLLTTHDAIAVTVEGDPDASSLPEGGIVLPDPWAWNRTTDDVPVNPSFPADRLAAIVFTSGSTGRPIGHRKSWGALVARSVAALDLLDPETESACIIGTVPPYHMYGFETLVLQSLNTRVSLSVGPSRYPADWQDQLRQAPAPRMLVTTPLQLRSLCRAGLDLPPVRRVISAAAPLDASVAADAEEMLKTEVMEIYGATEIGSAATRRTLEGPEWRLYDGIELSVTQAGATIAAPGAPAYPISDVVERTGARGFRLLGRIGDLIKLGGKRASLSALNAALNAIPGMEDGAFLPPDGERLADPAARMQVFAVAPGRTADEILHALKQHIDPIFLPRGIRMLDALPRNAVGKLTLASLRKLASNHEDEESLGAFNIPADHPCLAGHFPGMPVVPGVMMLDAGLACLANEWGDVGFPVHIRMVKFLKPVFPDETVQFLARRSDNTIWLHGRRADETVLRVVLEMKRGHEPA